VNATITTCLAVATGLALLPAGRAVAAEAAPGRIAAEPTPGRFAATAVPGAAGASPLVILLDTATGQSWTLVQLPGPPLHWAPLRFWGPGGAAGSGTGRPPELAPLPPGPAGVGARPLDGAAPTR